MSPEARTVAAGDADSAPTLVVLPGLDGTDVFSRPFVAGLPGHMIARTVCYPAWGPNRYEDLLEHARDAVSDLRDFYLFGSSFGGPLALMLAAAEPARVKGIILSATFASSPFPRLAPYRRAIVAPLVLALRAARRIPIWLKDSRDPLRIAKAETWQRTPARVLAARARAALAVDVRELVGRCAAPILSVGFDDDRVVPSACTHEIVRLRPSARSIVLRGGHLEMFSAPGALAAVVARFIEDVGAVRKAA